MITGKHDIVLSPVLLENMTLCWVQWLLENRTLCWVQQLLENMILCWVQWLLEKWHCVESSGCWKHDIVLSPVVAGKHDIVLSPVLLENMTLCWVQCYWRTWHCVESSGCWKTGRCVESSGCWKTWHCVESSGTPQDQPCKRNLLICDWLFQVCSPYFRALKQTATKQQLTLSHNHNSSENVKLKLSWVPWLWMSWSWPCSCWWLIVLLWRKMFFLGSLTIKLYRRRCTLAYWCILWDENFDLKKKKKEEMQMMLSDQNVAYKFSCKF